MPASFVTTQLTQGQLVQSALLTENTVGVVRQVGCLGDPIAPGALGGVQNVAAGAAFDSDGGAAAITIPVGSTGDTAIKAGPGRLCRVIVCVTGTNPMTFWDNTTGTHSGTVLGVLPASAAVGTVFNFQTPAAIAISSQGNAANPAVTVTYF